jgi:hypothetical protein
MNIAELTEKAKAYFGQTELSRFSAELRLIMESSPVSMFMQIVQPGTSLQMELGMLSAQAIIDLTLTRQRMRSTLIPVASIDMIVFNEEDVASSLYISSAKGQIQYIAAGAEQRLELKEFHLVVRRVVGAISK